MSSGESSVVVANDVERLGHEIVARLEPNKKPTSPSVQPSSHETSPEHKTTDTKGSMLNTIKHNIYSWVCSTLELKKQTNKQTVLSHKLII